MTTNFRKETLFNYIFNSNKTIKLDAVIYEYGKDPQYLIHRANDGSYSLCNMDGSKNNSFDIALKVFNSIVLCAYEEGTECEFIQVVF